MTELEDEKLSRDESLSNRQTAQRAPGQSLDGKGVQVEEHKDNPANRRPSQYDGTQTDDEIVAQEALTAAPQSNILRQPTPPGN